MASFTPLIAGQMSGSVGAIVFSHNKGGPYMRLRANPTQPNTIYQQVVKLVTGQLAAAWPAVLSQLQRDAWDVYAANVSRPKPGGGTQFLTGLMHFVRSNLGRAQVGLSTVLDAPVAFNVGGFTPITANIGVPPLGLVIHFTEADDWVTDTGAQMLIWTGRAQSAGKQFFKGPFRSVPGIPGDLASPPTTPITIAMHFPQALGTKMWLRVSVTRSDGRLSDSGIIPIAQV